MAKKGIYSLTERPSITKNWWLQLRYSAVLQFSIFNILPLCLIKCVETFLASRIKASVTIFLPWNFYNQALKQHWRTDHPVFILSVSFIRSVCQLLNALYLVGPARLRLFVINLMKYCTIFPERRQCVKLPWQARGHLLLSWNLAFGRATTVQYTLRIKPAVPGLIFRRRDEEGDVFFWGGFASSLISAACLMECVCFSRRKSSWQILGRVYVQRGGKKKKNT